MNRTLRALVPVLVISLAGTSLSADTTGRLEGRVTNKAQQAIVNAKVTLSRMDRSWTRSSTTNSQGNWRVIGLDPVEYVVTIQAEGYAEYKFKMKAPVGDAGHKDVALPTVAENGGSRILDESGEGTLTSGTSSSSASGEDKAALKEDADARAAFNLAIPLYNAKHYGEALPNLEKAHASMVNAIAMMKDEGAKADSQALLPIISKAYGLTLYQVGKSDEAIPLLSQIADADPKDTKNLDVVMALVDIYTKKKDDANRAKYQGILNAATGTSNASAPYNEGVRAFNANHFKEAKQHLLKAVEADASFPDSYYLLGLIEMNQGNMAGAKAHFRKYIELAPHGSHADEVKGALSAL